MSARMSSLMIFSLATLAGAMAFVGVTLVHAQTPPQPQPYRPGLGDLMTMTVQPRHTKLGLAGQEKNWTYAAYELHELEESFERAARVWPKYGQSNIAELLPSTTKEPMEALGAAIKAADSTKFTEAYGRLTDTCNACHQATARAMVVIQVPKISPFPDQDFRAQKQ